MEEFLWKVLVLFLLSVHVHLKNLADAFIQNYLQKVF